MVGIVKIIGGILAFLASTYCLAASSGLSLLVSGIIIAIIVVIFLMLIS